MGSGLRFWPHLWRLRSQPPAGAARSSRRRRFDPRVYGETCCAVGSFDSDRPDRYLQGAGLRAAAAGGPAKFPPAPLARRSLGKTPRPGVALHGPLADSHRECQKGKNNGGNYSEGSGEVVNANGLHRPAMQGKSMMKYKKKNGHDRCC